MELAGTTIVITGGASGIGAALAKRFAAEGPANLVLADRDIDGAREVARSVAAGVGGQCVPRQLDVGRTGANEALVADVETNVGPIDLFVANAGIATGASEQGDDTTWDVIWDINTMAHVRAARALVPLWLERGGGYLLTTASAAGLLTNLGDAPYSVTKAAAVAFAEWVSITYGDRGVKVSCLCPQGVRTPLLFPPGEEGDDSVLAAEVVRSMNIIEPEDVAESVVAGLADERFLILPHEEVARYAAHKGADRERWLAGMRKLQASLG
ncbi:MAG: SDR family oxidoreductase [Microthrixaceae bacterium]|nr:SDR family oxidoreductase [Microthrixaceae bacterium]